MPLERPDAAELVEAVSEFLEREVAPRLEGQPAFHLRVARNVLAIVGRELESGEAMAKAEHERLVRLLGEDGTLVELNAALARRLREGQLGEARQEILSHLRETVRDKLKLANPRYLAAAEEQG